MGDFVTVDSYRYHYEKRGKKGEPIVLLHGIPMNAYLWRKVQAGLEDNFQTYAIDMLGYGQSDKPAEADYSWTGQARRVAGFMDALGLKKAVVAGHDQGGGVALCFATQYPERLTKFMMINGCCYDYCLPRFLIRSLGTLDALPDEQLDMVRPMAVGFFSTALWGTLHNKNRLTIDVMNHYMDPWMTREGFRALLKHCNRPSNDETMNADLSKIKVPTLVVWATQDMALPVEAAYRLRRDIAGPVTLETIDDSGHFVQEEQPEKLAAIMTHWLLTHAPTAP